MISIVCFSFIIIFGGMEYEEQINRNLTGNQPFTRNKVRGQNQFKPQRITLRSQINVQLPDGYLFTKFVAPVKGRQDHFYIQIKEKKKQSTFLSLYSAEQNAIIWKTLIATDPYFTPQQGKYSRFQMVENDQFIAIIPQFSLISIIYPLQNERIDLKYKLGLAFLFVFQKTKYFLIVEPNISKFSYFTVETLKKSSQPLAIFEFYPFQSKYAKMDEKSKLWLDIQQKKENICGYFLQLQKTEEGQYVLSKRKLKSEYKNWVYHEMREKCRDVNKKSLFSQGQFSELFNWNMVGQLSPNEYLIILTDRWTSTNPLPLIIDISQGYDNAILKTIEIRKGSTSTYQFPEDFDLKMYILSDYIVLKVFVLLKFQLQPQKLLLVNKESWQLQIYKEMLEKQLQFWPIAGNSSAELQPFDSQSKDIYLTEWQLSIKDVYMQWLLHINEDFDDDLLFDCNQLLIQEE